MTDTRLPEDLRDAVAQDLQPVRPLSSVWKRLFIVACVALGVLAAVVVGHRLRPDMVTLGPWLGWGSMALELAVGLLIVGLALRESVPGLALGRPALLVAIKVAVLANVLVAVATWMGTGRPEPAAAGACGSFACTRNELAMAVPALLLTGFLVIRSFPLRPKTVGLLAGAGAGLMADGINHMMCPVSTLRHVLVWHSGGIVALMAFGWLVGWLWGMVRDRRLT